MRIKTFEAKIYDVGDVLDIDEKLKPESRKEGLYNAKKVMIISVHEKQNYDVSYKVITETGYSFTLKQSEMGKESFIGHIDLSRLFDGKDE